MPSFKHLNALLSLIVTAKSYSPSQVPGKFGALTIDINTCISADCGNCGDYDWFVPTAGY